MLIKARHQLNMLSLRRPTAKISSRQPSSASACMHMLIGRQRLHTTPQHYCRMPYQHNSNSLANNYSNGRQPVNDIQADTTPVPSHDMLARCHGRLSNDHAWVNNAGPVVHYHLSCKATPRSEASTLRQFPIEQVTKTYYV
jgi:hypothetical protein